MNIGPRGEGRWVALAVYVREAGLPCMPVHPSGTPERAALLGFLGPWGSDRAGTFGGLLPGAFLAANDPVNPADVLHWLSPADFDPKRVHEMREWMQQELPRPED